MIQPVFLLAAKSSWVHLVFSWHQLVKIPLIFVPSQRIENRWTSDVKREFSRWFWFKWKVQQNGRFLDLKNKREKAFLPFKTQLFHIQVVRYAASGNNITTWLSISYIDSKAIILVENHLNRGKMGCFRSHIFSCLLIITVFLSPSCPPVRLRGTKLCPKHILDTYNLKNW